VKLLKERAARIAALEAENACRVDSMGVGAVS
jgi:hypothetical protein